MQVTVASVVFDGSGDTDSPYLLTGIRGWFDGVDMRRDKTPRPRQRGMFRSDGYQGGRVVSLELEVRTESRAEQHDALLVLAALLADGSYSTLTVEEAGDTWSIEVGRDGEPDVIIDLYGVLATVRLQFWAPDPLWYREGVWQETAPPSDGAGLVWPVVWPAVWPGGGNPGRISLANSGLAASAPVFRLVGGFTSALITCTDTAARIGFDRVVPEGSYVDIDVAARSATINGQSDVSRWLRWREWETVPPETTRTYQFTAVGASGSPLLRGKVNSAWA